MTEKAKVSNVIEFDGATVSTKLIDELKNLVKQYPEEDREKICWTKEDKIYLQRGYLNKLKKFDIEDTSINIPAEIPFKGKLRDYQSNIIQKLGMERQGIILMPTASGKTVVMIALANLLREKTLIITHTTTILNQTRQRIKDFCGIEAGQIGDQVWEIDKPIVVGLIQTIEKRIDELDGQFGLILTDEMHHVSSRTWFSTISKFKARYRFGFTAELKRKDKKEFLANAVLGDVLVRLEPDGLARAGYLQIPEIHAVKTDFCIEKIHFCQARCHKQGDCDLKIEDCRYMKNGFWAYMLSKLTADVDRNAIIIKTIESNMKEGKFGLVLSDRKKHLSVLAEEIWTPSWVITGDLPTKERRKRAKEFETQGGVLFATSALLGEGYDLPQIDRLFLTCPAGGRIIVKQRLGRIMRPKEDKTFVFDFFDEHSSFCKALWFARSRSYKSFGANIIYPRRG